MGTWRNKLSWFFNFTHEFREEIDLIRRTSLVTIPLILLTAGAAYHVRGCWDDQEITKAHTTERAANESVRKLIMDQTDKELKESALLLSQHLKKWFKDTDDRIHAASGLMKLANLDTYYPRERERFDLEYRVRCRATRDAMLHRLGPQARDESAMKHYESPLTLKMLKAISDDLERLAMMLPVHPGT
jgi:hypothetical protein